MRTIPAGIATEVAAAANQPIELYEMELTGVTLYFARDVADVVFPTGGQTYTGWGIDRSPIRTDFQMSPNSVTVNFDDNDRVLQAYIINNRHEFRGKTLTIKKVFADALGNSANFVPLFDGLMDVPTVDQNKFSVRVKSWVASLDVTCPRRMYQPLCFWTFGDANCTETKDTGTGIVAVYTDATHIILGNITATGDGTVRTDHWNGGFITITDAGTGTIETKKVKDSQDNFEAVDPTTDITLYAPFKNFTPAFDDVVTAVQGCDKTKANCLTPHDNILNFGGFLSATDKWTFSVARR